MFPEVRFHDIHFVWFSMRDGFFSPQVSESHSSRFCNDGGFWRRVVRNPSHMENYANEFSHILYTLKHVNHANIIQS